MRGLLDGQPVTKGAQHGPKRAIASLLVGADHLPDFVEPGVGDLEGLVDDVESGSTHALTS
jgi:hypothetical protein